MKPGSHSRWKPALLLLVLMMLVSTSKISGFVSDPQKSLSEKMSSANGSLFRFVWDERLGSWPVRGGYYLLSDKVFPLKVYILNLPSVGNCRFSNHSEIVEGCKRAVEMSGASSDVEELKFWVNSGGDLVAKLNVNVSCTIVEDWSTFRTVVESTSNVIVINTHGEFLPVPEGYQKEDWNDKIADFMLNRWGTWVHMGGYPLFRVWFQNGTQVEWGDEGFRRLMSHIGKGNATCYPPGGKAPEDWGDIYDDSATIGQYLASSFRLWPEDAIGSIPGYPLKWSDFGELNEFTMFSIGIASHSAIRFSPNSTSFNFGVYVHLGTWGFQSRGFTEMARSASYAGFVSTAVAIFEDYSVGICRLYGRLGDSASEVIQMAEQEGRTLGLAEAMSFFQNALDAYAKGDYKAAASYGEMAVQAGMDARAPLKWPIPPSVAAIAIVIFGAGGATYYHFHKKRGQTA